MARGAGVGGCGCSQRVSCLGGLEVEPGWSCIISSRFSRHLQEALLF